MRSLVLILVSFFALLVVSGTAFAQNADNRTNPFGRQREEDQPLNIVETMAKMRIEKEKKEYDKMLERGEEALKIAGELEKAFEGNGKLSDAEVAKLAALEKLSKQIRSDLGGGDDDEIKSLEEKPARLPHSEAIRTLKSAAAELFSHLKKTSRFTVSAAAIQSSNAVLRLSRVLRITN